MPPDEASEAAVLALFDRLAKKEYEEAIAPLKWKCVEPVEWAGAADDATLALLRERGRELARNVKGA